MNRYVFCHIYRNNSKRPARLLETTRLTLLLYNNLHQQWAWTLLAWLEIPLHGHRSVFAHTSTTCENEGHESASLSVKDPSAISQPLLALVLTIKARETLTLIGWCHAPGPVKTLTSKRNASFLPVSESQKPRARMSSLASSPFELIPFLLLR